jgi:hypothetical protein
MPLLHCEEAYFFSSDLKNGAKNKSVDGSTFSVQLNSPIAIPKESIYCTLEVTTATIWNVSPNISAAIGNNKLYLTYGSIGNVITVADGLYGVDELASSIQREMVDRGLPSDLIILTADPATQKVIITFNYPNTRINFDFPNTFRDILGFNERRVPLVDQTAAYSEVGDTTAEFNRIVNYLIKSDIISDGISVNAISDSVIADVLITAAPGSQIVYTPYNPPKANADELAGHRKNFFNFRLTDQSGRAVDTLGENYSFTIVIKYVLRV